MKYTPEITEKEIRFQDFNPSWFLVSFSLIELSVDGDKQIVRVTQAHPRGIK